MHLAKKVSAQSFGPMSCRSVDSGENSESET
eukprot:COSAG04_NODE_15606_length_526_cov_1.672131_1_plen_30_part_01